LDRLCRMDPRGRVTSVWYRIGGLLRWKDRAIDIVAGEIRSASHETLLDLSQQTASSPTAPHAATSPFRIPPELLVSE